MKVGRDRKYRMAIALKNNTCLQRKYWCMTAYVDINKMLALTLFNSGSSIDGVSSEFTRVAGLKVFQLNKLILLQLEIVET